MFTSGTIDFGKTTNDRKERVDGRLLRRVSMVMQKPRGNIATISNNYDLPDHPGATIPDGLFMTYTPVSDDSIIRVRVGCYLYRGGSNSDGTSARNDYFMMRYMWQFGEQSHDYQFHREYASDGYRIFKTDVPSWGKGKSAAVRWRVVNYHPSGYFRTNIYYNNGFDPSWNQRFDGDKCLALMPQICVEEYSATEPSESPMIEWDANNVDF